MYGLSRRKSDGAAGFLLRDGQSAPSARDVVGGIAAVNRHEFWPDSISFADVQMSGDVYLAHLVRSRNGQLATLDNGLAHLDSDVAVLIPTAT